MASLVNLRCLTPLTGKTIDSISVDARRQNLRSAL